MFDGLFKSLISLGKYAANTVVTDQLSKICSPYVVILLRSSYPEHMQIFVPLVSSFFMPYFPSVRTIPADGQAAQIALPHMHIVS